MLSVGCLLVLSLASAPAATTIGPWVPLFRGIEHAVATNIVDGSSYFPDLQVVHCLRVDLTDPGLTFFTSPRRTNWVANGAETYGMTCTNFVRTYNLQIGLNCNRFFQPGSSSSPSYTLTEGTAMNASGLLISQGVLVSPGESASDNTTIYLSTNNTPSFYLTNWPMASTAGVYTAISGHYPLVYNGLNVASNNSCVRPGDLDPRTAFGITPDQRYLLLMVIDGRQSGYSAGACDWETAEWMKLFGAYNAVNVDGGGSSCMVMQSSTGQPVALNRDSAVPSVGRERTVGASFGIYAQPLPGLFTNVNALPDDTAATVTWTTTSAATTQLKYGTTTNLTSLTASNSALVTEHAALLTNLTVNTGYYFAALASIANSNYTSPTYFFTTTNYVTTNVLFDLTNEWKYMTANLDGVNWKARTYDDSGWTGSGLGLLWTDIRGANANIPADLLTEMPTDGGTGNPYLTYYFRAHFNFTNTPTGATLQVDNYIDDGAVFYLNGVEIYRLRMAAAPTTILNSTLASGYACSGDADCLNTFSVSGPVITTNLLSGDNVLAVEVHNYSAGSPDITFGVKATLTLPYTLRPVISVTKSNSAVRLKWDQGGYTLQQANAPTGTWADVSGPVVSSPFVTNNSTGNRFFRLKK